MSTPSPIDTIQPNIVPLCDASVGDVYVACEFMDGSLGHRRYLCSSKILIEASPGLAAMIHPGRFRAFEQERFDGKPLLKFEAYPECLQLVLESLHGCSWTVLVELDILHNAVLFCEFNDFRSERLTKYVKKWLSKFGRMLSSRQLGKLLAIAWCLDDEQWFECATRRLMTEAVSWKRVDGDESVEGIWVPGYSALIWDVVYVHPVVPRRILEDIKVKSKQTAEKLPRLLLPLAKEHARVRTMQVRDFKEYHERFTKVLDELLIVTNMRLDVPTLSDPRPSLPYPDGMKWYAYLLEDIPRWKIDQCGNVVIGATMRQVTDAVKLFTVAAHRLGRKATTKEAGAEHLYQKICGDVDSVVYRLKGFKLSEYKPDRENKKNSVQSYHLLQLFN